MSSQIDPLMFTVPLSLAAHTQAEQFRRHHSNPRKAKQVYFNTLAVYAVNYYLQCLGFETDLEGSESWNPVMQTLMDVADLVVKNHGKLECRPVLANTECVDIPAEVRSERIGYVAVKIHESLKAATLLGFAERVETDVFPLRQLRPLDDLHQHLNQLRHPEPVPETIALSYWLENLFEAGWQTVENLLNPPQPTLNFRLASPLDVSQAENPSLSVSRGKLLDLGAPSASEQVALVVGLTSTAEPEVEIWVKVSPTGDRTHLPPNLQLMVLDEAGIAVMQAQARNTETILLKFNGEPGERFSLKLTLNDISLSEAFVI